MQIVSKTMLQQEDDFIKLVSFQQIYYRWGPQVSAIAMAFSSVFNFGNLNPL
jgi:hypothetical protein